MRDPGCADGDITTGGAMSHGQAPAQVRGA